MNYKKVKMKFSEHKYYNDLSNPMFEKGKVYELEGSEWITRWLKRGGEIIEELPEGKIQLELPTKELEPVAVEEEKSEDITKDAKSKTKGSTKKGK